MRCIAAFLPTICEMDHAPGRIAASLCLLVGSHVSSLDASTLWLATLTLAALTLAALSLATLADREMGLQFLDFQLIARLCRR